MYPETLPGSTCCLRCFIVIVIGHAHSERARVSPLPLMPASKQADRDAGGGVVIGQRIAHGRTYLSWGLAGMLGYQRSCPPYDPLFRTANGGPLNGEVCDV